MYPRFKNIIKMSSHTDSQPAAPSDPKPLTESSLLRSFLTGFTLPALLILVAFIGATGFYIVERPGPVSTAENARMAFDKRAAIADANQAESASANKTEIQRQSYVIQPVTLILHSRIAESLAHNTYPERLTLFPKVAEFESVFPESNRVHTFIKVSRAFSEQTVNQLQTEVPIAIKDLKQGQRATQSTAMMLEYIGAGFPNVGTWLDDYNSFDAVAASFRKTGVSDSLLPQQYFRPLLVGTLANVSCNGNDARVVNRRADRYRKRVQKLAERFKVDPDLILAVAAQESCFYSNASSPAGAQGLMQLMPGTASLMGVGDAYDPDENLKGGVRYLSMLQKQFESPELVLAAYNAGPGSVKRYDGIPPFAETQHYVTKVLSFYRSFKAAAVY